MCFSRFHRTKTCSLVILGLRKKEMDMSGKKDNCEKKEVVCGGIDIMAMFGVELFETMNGEQ